jgi:ATP-dependent RNA helicase DDX27
MMQIKQIVAAAPRKRQTLLFSATMTARVADLVTLSLTAPVRLAADAAAAAPAALRQEVLRLKGSASVDKPAVLLAIMSRTLTEGRTIIFCTQKWQAHRLRVVMGLAGLPPAAELHGDMTQARLLCSVCIFVARCVYALTSIPIRLAPGAWSALTADSVDVLFVFSS